MAESMQGLKRSHRCTEVSSANIGEKVTVMGWVQKSRNKGGIIFVEVEYYRLYLRSHSVAQSASRRQESSVQSSLQPSREQCASVRVQ